MRVSDFSKVVPIKHFIEFIFGTEKTPFYSISGADIIKKGGNEKTDVSVNVVLGADDELPPVFKRDDYPQTLKEAFEKVTECSVIYWAVDYSFDSGKDENTDETIETLKLSFNVRLK